MITEEEYQRNKRNAVLLMVLSRYSGDGFGCSDFDNVRGKGE